MSSRVKQILDYFYSINSRGIKPGLERIKVLCELLDNPQNSFPSVIVAGTNGKGSTAAFLGSLLQKAQFKVGSYFSPHLEVFNERISVNGKLISDERIFEIASPLIENLEKYKLNRDNSEKTAPTFFEFTTALAFQFFKEEKIDLAVLEIGLGGRFDAVNIVARPLLSIITNISIDHTDYLGSTIEMIANEKAGIIKNGRPLITAEESPKIVKIFEKEASLANSKIYKIGADFSFSKVKERTFDYNGLFENLKGIELSLYGDHQFKNASLALAGYELLKDELNIELSPDEILSSLKNASIAGRLEEIKTPYPFRVILDGAHNIGGSIVLSKYLKERFKQKDLVLMIGIMQDKNHDGMIKNYLNLSEKIILVRPKIDRAWDPETMKKISECYKENFLIIEDIGEALRFCKTNLKKDQTLCITGSLYTVGEARTLLTHRNF